MDGWDLFKTVKWKIVPRSWINFQYCID
jgi:hypothetical protein